MDSPISALQNVIAWALPVLLAVTLHEVAHGWAARALGDPTAKTLYWPKLVSCTVIGRLLGLELV